MLRKIEFYWHFQKKKNTETKFYENASGGGIWVVHTEDREADIAFRNFANAPKIVMFLILLSK